jgi:two-component system, LytTR family, response regulator
MKSGNLWMSADRIRVVVADDEPLARRGVRQLLAPHREMVVVGEGRNGPDTLRVLRELSPDLLFLDIQMPEMDGLEVVRAYGPERIPPVIFITAHDHFAVQAFETHALDYLVKPLVTARFEAALRHFRDRRELIQAAGMAEQLKALLAEKERHEVRERDRLIVPVPGGSVMLPVTEIDWIEADDYYARIHAGARQYLLREPLSSLESRLDATRFVRIHRSLIVQIDRVRELKHTPGSSSVVLKDGRRMPVSRRRRSILTNLFCQGACPERS